MYSSEKEKLNKFIELRNKYIDMLDNKIISKSEFNHLNNEIFSKINLRPFTVLDSFDKALYNYNYYNSKAKMYLEEYNKYKMNGNNKRAKLAYNNVQNNYYHKDISIEAMLKLENAKFINAYFVDIKSKRLNSKLYEIYFSNKERVILHTQNENIKKILIQMKCFESEKKDSLIKSYINS